jgi:endoglucanase
MFRFHHLYMRRRHFLRQAFWLGLATPTFGIAEPDGFPWRAFVVDFIQSDGRVIDHGEQGRSTSEGQAYAMFFALVANDRERFRLLLEWTERNLAGNDLRRHLPAWLWGKSLTGRWQVLDANPASDADLWLSYVLLEAGRLWGEPAYSELGLAVLARVSRLSVAQLPGFGPMLLPAPQGFAFSGSKWRINPSYLVPQQLRRFAVADPTGPWSGLAASMPSMLRAVAPLGIVPDWAIFASGRWLPDAESNATGSYDAVRAYLWTGMMSGADPLRAALLDAQRGLRAHMAMDGQLPERIDSRSGKAMGRAPVGFHAALLPWLSALGDTNALASERSRVSAAGMDKPAVGTRTYYDRALAVFGMGWLDGHFRFDPQGRLVTHWAS